MPIDYTPEVCFLAPETDSTSLTYDRRGGSRWRSTGHFVYGSFSSFIRCPEGDTSGLNFNMYLSSLEGDKSQEEINFEFLGKDENAVETNLFIAGTGNREQIHDLGFDYSDGFHEYMIKWIPNLIEWFIDREVTRKEESRAGEGFPEKPIFLFASVFGILAPSMRVDGQGLVWVVMHPMFVSTKTSVCL